MCARESEKGGRGERKGKEREEGGEGERSMRLREKEEVKKLKEKRGRWESCQICKLFWQPIVKFSIHYSRKKEKKNILIFLHFLHYINNFVLLFK